MNCTCITTYQNNRFDPTRTTVLRRAFVKDMDRRFNGIAKLIKKAIVDENLFGWDSQLQTYGVTPGQEAFKFHRSPKKVDEFMRWINKQVDQDILRTRTYQQAGTSIEGAWTNMYIEDSYKRGLQRSRYEMIKAGFDVPTIDETGGIVAAMNQPFHMDRVGVLYTRTFNELQGITAAMEQQISRVLSQGMIDGDNPRLMAQKLLATMDGKGAGKLGMTDTLGRFIPAKRRAEMLARTEIIRAHHAAMVQEYRNYAVEGVVVQAEWLTAEDGRVCELCIALSRGGNNGVYTLDEIEGMIPAHPNCRCIALPKKVEAVKSKSIAEPEQKNSFYTEDGVEFKNVSEKEYIQSQKNILNSTRELVEEEYGEVFKPNGFSPEIVNKGFCDQYADSFIKKYGGDFSYTETISDSSGTFGHVFVRIEGRWFDAETFNGVKNINELPYFQRASAYYGRKLTNAEILETIIIGNTMKQKIPIPINLL